MLSPRYAVIKVELLAVSWAINKCKQFVVGLPHFTIITDHHPPIPIIITGWTKSRIHASKISKAESWPTNSLVSGSRVFWPMSQILSLENLSPTPCHMSWWWNMTHKTNPNHPLQRSEPHLLVTSTAFTYKTSSASRPGIPINHTQHLQ